MKDIVNGMIAGMIAGVIGFILILIFVFATGSTFGQRCTKAFPNDAARQKICVTHLANGKAHDHETN